MLRGRRTSSSKYLYRWIVQQASWRGKNSNPFFRRDEIKCMVRLDFPTTNNEAEYEALMAGLDLAKAARATSMVVYCDSQVVTSQVNGDYECKG